MNRFAWICISVVSLVVIVGLSVSGAWTPRPEPGIFPVLSQRSLPAPVPSQTTAASTNVAGPTVGFELVPVADAARKELATVNGMPHETRCAAYLGETYFPHIPEIQRSVVHSKLDTGGNILTVTRLWDGSVMINYDAVVTAIILGDDFAFSPYAGTKGRFWINPDSFGPITETHIGVCVRQR